MPKFIVRLAMLTVLAAIGAMSAAGTAGANTSISVSPGGNILTVSLGLLSFRSIIGGLLVDIRCNVTLHGSLANIIRKNPGDSFGNVRSGQSAPCAPTAGANTTAITSGFPWNLTYQSFTGTLPNINLITFFVRQAQFTLSIPGLCNTLLLRGDVPASILTTPGRPVTTAGLIHVLRNRVPRISSTAGCPAEGELVGLFNLLQRQTLILL